MRNQAAFKNDTRIDFDALYGNTNQTLYEFDSQVTRVLAGYVRPRVVHFQIPPSPDNLTSSPQLRHTTRTYPGNDTPRISPSPSSPSPLSTTPSSPPLPSPSPSPRRTQTSSSARRSTAGTSDGSKASSALVGGSPNPFASSCASSSGRIQSQGRILRRSRSKWTGLGRSSGERWLWWWGKRELDSGRLLRGSWRRRGRSKTTGLSRGSERIRRSNSRGGLHPPLESLELLREIWLPSQ